MIPVATMLAPDTRAFDGLRALCCAAVISFHTFIYWGRLLPQEVGYQVGWRWWASCRRVFSFSFIC